MISAKHDFQTTASYSSFGELWKPSCRQIDIMD